MPARTFDEDLDRAVAFHGHLCAGQVIGTRMARLALAYFHIDDADTYRDLVAFVECDRCLADAVTVVANCHIGRRRLKWYDYGIMSATFYDMRTERAIRISQQPDAPHCPHDADPRAFFADVPDCDLFLVHEVTLPNLEPWDLPSGSRKTVVCERCGERVHDGRAIERNGHVYCRRCGGEHVYYVEGVRLSPEEVERGV